MEKQADRPGVGCLSVWIVIGTLFCGVFFINGAYGVLRTLSARFWKKVPGVLLQAQVEEDDSGDGNPTFSVEVRYTYRVSGVDYSGARLTPGTAFYSSDEDGAYRTVAKLQQEHPLIVYYNPHLPAESALIRSPQSGWFIGFTWGCGFYLLCVVCPISFLLQPNRKKRVTLLVYIGSALILIGSIGFLPILELVPDGWWLWGVLPPGILLALYLFNARQAKELPGLKTL